MHQIKAVFTGNFDYIENIKVSPFSSAVTCSDSVYEVIPFYKKQFILFKGHIERLQRSAPYCGSLASLFQIRWKEFGSLPRRV